MKTTIDIADDLIKRARLVQQREHVTFRALVEEGLRSILEKRAKPGKKYKFDPVVVGKAYMPGMAVPDFSRILDEANDRPWVEREFGKPRIAEKRTTYRARKKAARHK